MKRLEALAATLFGVAFLALAAAVTAEVIMRKVFNRSLQGVDELGGYILAIAGALSFAVALGARAHIRIDIVHDRLPRLLRVGLNLLAATAIVVCGAALLRMAWFAFDESAALGATAQTPWATPLQYPQGLWTAALATFLALGLAGLLRIGLLLARGDLHHVDHWYGPRTPREELEEELADAKARGVTADVVLPGGGRP
jgi:TRAP-type C4-dicarboxylate transport system permease small subunit